MLNSIQSAVDSTVSAATEGRLTTLRLATPPPGKGDVAVCIGPLVQSLGLPPLDTAEVIIQALSALPCIASTAVSGPFVNIRLDADALAKAAMEKTVSPGIHVEEPQRIMVEYLSPNTNKPLHLGHLRNGVLGSVLSKLLSAVGHTVIRSELINDRGEHICKSMLAYMRHGNGTAPESSGKKGDHFVGDMYVAYMKDDKARRSMIQAAAASEVERWASGNAEVHQLLDAWRSSDRDKDKKDALKALLKLTPDAEARSKQLLTAWDAPDPEIVDLLERWEAGDPEVLALWRKMNEWVYAGFSETKPRYGFFFEKVYYESDLYTLGKDLVHEGLARGVFVQDKTGAILFDLPVKEYGTNQDGKPHRRKVLNNNGTSVYLTQDIGTAVLKANNFDLDRSIYVVANEQDPHFTALFAILRALGYDWANRCYHMSYAMVKLPSGKMKSREGTVVDADNLADEMAALAAAVISSRNPDLDHAEVARRAEVIGMAAIKFYLARFSPTSEIMFSAESSLSFEGDTGPYCLYTYARAQSVIAKAETAGISPETLRFSRLGNDDERACLLEVMHFADGVRRAAEHYAPSILTDRMFALCASFNRFYKNHHVMSEDKQLTKERLALVRMVAATLHWGFSFFEISPLEKM